MQGLAYNTNLRESLNLGNMIDNRSGASDISSVVINPRFSGWKQLVAERLVLIPSFKSKSEELQYRKYLPDPDYADYELFQEAQEHASTYNRPIRAENIIALTHPLHLHLSNMSLLNSPSKKKEAARYLDQFLGLLELRLPKEKVGIVIFESLYHYAAATSLFLENGLIDMVVFTDVHSGEIKTEPDDSTFVGKQIFIGGGCNFNEPHVPGCLAVTNKYLEKKARPPKHFWAIQDLVINHPSCADRFDYFTYPRNVLIGGVFSRFPRSRVISLEETLKKIGCEKYAHPGYSH